LYTKIKKILYLFELLKFEDVWTDKDFMNRWGLYKHFIRANYSSIRFLYFLFNIQKNIRLTLWIDNKRNKLQNKWYKIIQQITQSRKTKQIIFFKHNKRNLLQPLEFRSQQMFSKMNKTGNHLVLGERKEIFQKMYK
jgi:hypothetical protein